MDSSSHQSSANPSLEEIGRLLQQGRKEEALRTARSHVETAVAAGGPDRIALAWTNLAQTCAALNDFPEAAKALEKAVAVIPGTDDSPELALPRFRCLLGLGQVLIRLDRKKRARETLKRALVAAAALGSGSARNRSQASIHLAWVLLESGETDQALPLLEEAAAELARGEPDHGNLVQALALLANARVRKGEEHALLPDHVPRDFPMPMLAQGLAGHLQQLAGQAGEGRLDPRIPRDLARWTCEWLSRVAGDGIRLTADTYGMLAALEGMCKRPDHQAEALEKAEKKYRKLGENTMAARAARARAMVLAEKGDLTEAERVQRAALAEARATEDAELVSESAQALAQILHARENHAECEELLAEAIAQADRVENLDLAATAALSLGLVMAHSGRLAEAQPHFLRAANRIPRANQLHQVAQAHIEAHRRGVPCPCDPAAQRRERPSTPQAESLFSPGYTEMMKQVLPEDLANKLEAMMAKLPKAGSPGMDPETARMLQEMEARTMQRLQGMMGMLKKPE